MYYVENIEKFAMEGQEALIHAIHLNAGKNYDLITDVF